MALELVVGGDSLYQLNLLNCNVCVQLLLLMNALTLFSFPPTNYCCISNKYSQTITNRFVDEHLSCFFY